MASIENGTPPVASKSKKTAVEEIYQKKSQLEHILLRPDTYIDNKQRDPTMDTIKVDINKDENIISVWNNGKGIPVVEHKDEKMYVPTMIPCGCVSCHN